VPPLAARFIRTALLLLLLSFAAGAWALAAKGTAAAMPAGLRGAHAELALVGWALQLALGVAYWILPKHAAGPPRGDAAPVATSWLLLNAGLAVAVLGAAAGHAPLVAGGRLLELGAVALFARHALPRIKAFGR
jgi:hypothetical protein